MRWRAFVPVLLALASVSASAAAEWEWLKKLPKLPEQEWLPGAPRTLHRSTSASRDTPVLEAAYGPQAQSNLGIEFAIRRLDFGGFSVRGGVHILAALENAEAPKEGLPFVATQMWRGIWGSSMALSADRLGLDLLGERGAIELTVVYGHESDHMEGEFLLSHPGFQKPPPPGDIVAGPSRDFFQPDLAVRFGLAPKFELVVRAQDRLYLSGPILHAPGAEAILRYRLTTWIHPFTAVFGELLLTGQRDNQARDGAFFRAMLGAALPGRFGEVIPFGSLDVGNGKGFLINRREFHPSVGLRYSPF